MPSSPTFRATGRRGIASPRRLAAAGGWLAPSPLMLAGLVIAIPVILALVVALAAVVLTLMVFWTVLTVVTWRLLGHRGALPGPWTVAAHRRRRIQATRRNAVSGFVPWL